MFSIAYRILGSATEAEDIIQEAFPRFHKETSGGTEVDSAQGLPVGRHEAAERLTRDPLRVPLMDVI